MVSWSKNIFHIPTGKAGRDFIEELTRLIDLFNHKTAWKSTALLLVHIFIPIMLQKSHAKSKPKENSVYLQKRLNLWSQGDLVGLMKESREIQKRIQAKSKKDKESNHKAFCRLMMNGKISQALKFVNNEDNATSGVHDLNNEVISILEDKHPQPGTVQDEALLDTSKIEQPQGVIFESITAEAIIGCAKDLSGSGGSTNVDADVWRHMLCSKFNEKQSKKLAQAIADLTKILCTEEIDPEHLQELLSGRLIPLKKPDNGVRPIGIGEVLRRIIAKTVTQTLKQDILMASGSLQTCSGIESGIEAAVHSMRRVYEEEESQGMLLIDASNAFNSLNREVAINNIKVLCPTFHQFLKNCYQCPTKLFISGQNTHGKRYIYSKEGATQGDPAAMAKYAIGTRPLLDRLGTVIDDQTAKQCWYADDATAAGKLESLKKWWDEMCTIGPQYGYFPNAKKTVLIVKSLEFLPTANSLFANTGIKISLEGERHLGAVIGSENFRKEYVSNKVKGWVKDVLDLADIAKEDPQLAYSAYTKGLSHRWTFVQRTIKDISELFNPLEDAITNNLIPALTGRTVSDTEREIIALPLRYGGLGMQNPVKTADREFHASNSITEELQNLICRQDPQLANFDKSKMLMGKQVAKSIKEARLKSDYDNLKNQLPKDQQRAFEQATHKGASSWLSALPLKALGYCLNKAEFRDSICLRYNWKIKDIHNFCACGAKNDIDHVMTCKKGGYVSFRHNALRDTEAELLKEVCRDVRTEPLLLPTDEKSHPPGYKHTRPSTS